MTEATLPQAHPSEAKLESELVALGLNAPRVTPDMIDSMIDRTDFIMLPGGSHMICRITLNGGFSVIGESKTVSAANFNADKAQEISYQKARDAVWPVAGAILAHELHNGRMPLSPSELKLPQEIQLVITELNQVMRRLKTLGPMLVDPDLLTEMGVPEEEIALLKEQHTFMAGYSETLQKRLARVGL